MGKTKPGPWSLSHNKISHSRNNTNEFLAESYFAYSYSHGNSDERALSVMMVQEPRLRWVRVGKKLNQQRRETQ